MNSKIIIFTILILLIGGGGVYYASTQKEQKAQEDTKETIEDGQNGEIPPLEDVSPNNEVMQESARHVVIKSVSTAFGGADEMVLYSDKSFKHFNNYPMNPEATCVQGVVDDKDFESFMDYLSSSQIIHAKINQSNERGLICEGSSRMSIILSGEENVLHFPCVSSKTPATEQVAQLMREIDKRLLNIINRSQYQECQDKM